MIRLCHVEAQMVMKRLSIALVALSTGAVVAAELTDFVPAEDGASACWQRIYDEAHLAAHPDQQVTAMTLSMSFARYDETDPGLHYFGLKVALRDGRHGTAAGGCHSYDGDVRCGVDCDGGGFALSLRDDGALRADLEAYGYVTIESGCGGGENETFALEPGLDDKLFLLHPTHAKVCKTLLPEW